MPRERGMIFSDRSVLEILAGRKTQTRRPLQPQPEHLQRHEWRGELVYDGEHRMWCWKTSIFDNIWDFPDNSDRRCLVVAGPWGHLDQHIYVKEAWAENDPPSGYVYRADWPYDHRSEWRNAMFMPRKAARIFLDVTEVRVQKLLEISEEDAVAEGCGACEFQDGQKQTAVEDYRWHWEKLHGKGSWEQNLFVWAISFRRNTSCK